MGETKKILLVEDDPFLSSLLKNRLQKEGGFDVALASSGDEALRILETLHPDLVLLDIILPGKSGFEVLEELRKHPDAQWPIIIISNLGQDIDIAKARELGASDYFIKARTSIDTLIAKIKALTST